MTNTRFDTVQAGLIVDLLRQYGLKPKPMKLTEEDRAILQRAGEEAYEEDCRIRRDSQNACKNISVGL